MIADRRRRSAARERILERRGKDGRRVTE